MIRRDNENFLDSIEVTGCLAVWTGLFLLTKVCIVDVILKVVVGQGPDQSGQTAADFCLRHTTINVCTQSY